MCVTKEDGKGSRGNSFESPASDGGERHTQALLISRAKQSLRRHKAHVQ